MILNAANIPLNQNSGTLPDVSGAMLDYFQPMTFTTIVKTVVNAILVETPTVINSMGVWQPFTERKLMMKPEGQRSWKWFTLHADIALILQNDQVVTYLGVQYRVMAQLDYRLYGYVEYHLIEDFTGSGP